MTASRFLMVYLVALPIFFAIDLVWLVWVARGFYKTHLSHLLSDQVNWGAAISFYLVFIGGIVFFAVRPALDADSATRALTYGALFGFLTYATYDLTNQATLRDWPLLVTAVDMLWGTILSASVAYASYQVSSRIL